MRLSIKLGLFVLGMMYMASALRANHKAQEHAQQVNYPFMIRSCLDQTKYLTGDRKNEDVPLRFQTKQQADKGGREIIMIANPYTFDLPRNQGDPPYKLLPDGVVTYRQYAKIGTTLMINKLESTTLQFKIEDCPNVNDLGYKMIKVQQGSFFQSQTSYLFMKQNGQAMFFNEKNNAAELQKLEPCFVLEKIG